MFGLSSDGGRPTLLITTVKSVVVIGALSFLAANWLSGSALDHDSLKRLVFDASSGLDPLTTGSVGPRADRTRLDPCALPRR